MTALACFSIILAISSIVRGDDEVSRTNLRLGTSISTNNDERVLQLLGHGQGLDTIWDQIDSVNILDGMSMPLSDQPSASPVLLSDAPSGMLSVPPSASLSASPVTTAPAIVSSAPVIALTTVPIASPTKAPTTSSVAPSATPTIAPTISAVDSPSSSPVLRSEAPVVPPATSVPTLSNCVGLTADERIERILAILDTVVDSDLIRDNSSPQGRATTWLLDDDPLQVCPSEESCEMLQRWTLAVVYFSTGGDDWFQCSSTYENNPTDNCGADAPFENDQRFLSNATECNWAGIACNATCVTEIVFGTYHFARNIAFLFAKRNNHILTCIVKLLRGKQLIRNNTN
jgi:hypothetical protein